MFYVMTSMIQSTSDQRAHFTTIEQANH